MQRSEWPVIRSERSVQRKSSCRIRTIPVESPIRFAGVRSNIMIRLSKLSMDQYLVSATAAQWRGGESWESSEPLTAVQLGTELARRGFHVQDITDAIAEADRSGSAEV